MRASGLELCEIYSIDIDGIKLGLSKKPKLLCSEAEKNQIKVRRSASKVLDSASTDPNPFFRRDPETWRLTGVMTPSLGTIPDF